MDNPSGTSTNPASVGTQNNGPRRPPYGGGGYGGRGFGFPGMGMGLGMGVGMRPMGGQGSFLDPFMASLQWLHSLNYIIYTVGHMADMVGMNAHAIVQAIQAVRTSIQNFINLIKKSQIRIWLRQKSKKSKLLRYIFVILSMALTGAVIKLLQKLHIYYIEHEHEISKFALL